METNGYSIEREVMLRKEERADDIDEVLAPRDVTNQVITQRKLNEIAPQETKQKQSIEEEQTIEETTETKIGRPQMTNEQRTSDPQNAIRGKIPKPSNPQGSL